MARTLHSRSLGRVVAGSATALALGLLGPTTSADAAPPAWAMRAVPAASSYSIKWVSCRAKGCVALASECSPGGCGGIQGVKPFDSSNGGRSWRAGVFPVEEGNAEGLSCASSTFCVTTAVQGPLGRHVADTIDLTKTAGASWSSRREPAWTTGVAACASTTTCFVFASPSRGSFFDTELLRTTNGGATWAGHAYTRAKGYIYGAACSTRTQCVAVGSSEAGGTFVFVTHNAGASWASVRMPPSASGFSSVSCHVLTCAALGSSTLAISRNGGKSWWVHPLPSGTTQYRSVSCLTGTECVLAGYVPGTPLRPAVEVTHNSGSSWRPMTLPHVLGALFAVQCTSSTSCVAGGARYVYSGATATALYPLVLTS